MLCVAVAGAAAAPALNDAQRAWLEAAPAIRFAPERDYGPFVYQGADGRIAGLSVDMLRLIEAQAGLRITTLPAAALHEVLQGARRRDVDLVSSLRPTPERAEYLRFTRPYVSVPAVLMGRAGRADLRLAALAGRPVAVGRGYAVEAVMRARHPDVRWQAVDNDVVALQGVADGRWDAAVVDAASAAFVQREHALGGLAVAGAVGFEYVLSFGVRSDWPQLQEILDASIHALPPQQRLAVLDRWLAAPGDDALAARAPAVTLLALALLAAAVLLGLLAARARRRMAQPGGPGAKTPPGPGADRHGGPS